jgi:hypothetical protein
MIATTNMNASVFSVEDFSPIRTIGLKSADSLWSRLILDLNRAKEVVLHTVEQVRGLVAGFRAIFSGACT